jgi:hypothetical protein
MSTALFRDLPERKANPSDRKKPPEESEAYL